MATELLSQGEWYELAKWPKRGYFFTRAIALCPHSSGAIYFAAVGVNRRTNAWDGVVFVAPPSGGVRLHHEFIKGRNLDSNAAAIAMIEAPIGNALAGHLVVTMTTESLDFSPPFWVITP